MGCFVSRANTEALLSKIEQNKEKIKEYNALLSKPTGQDPDLIEINNLSSTVHQELELSCSNFDFLFKYFALPEITKEEFKKRVSDVLTNTKSKSYITLRLEKSDIEKVITNRFLELILMLKKVEKEKNQRINNKALSLDKIITQANISDLFDELKRIKEKQIECSSYRGGEFEDIVLRTNKRYELDKDLELIQTKLEAKQYSEMLAAIDEESKELYAEITDLRNKRSDQERAWDMVKLNTKSNDAEIAQLKAIHEELQPKVDVVENEVIELRARKTDFENKMAQILELQRLTAEVELDIELKQKELDFNRKNKQTSIEFQQKAEWEQKIQENNDILENLKKKLQELENSENNPEVNKGLSEEQEKLIELDKMIEEQSNISLKLSEEIAQISNKNKNKLKGFVVSRLGAAMNTLMEKFYFKWRCMVNMIKIKERDNDILCTEVVNSPGLMRVNSALEEENKSILENNEIIMSIKDTNEKPMSHVNLFKFLEGLMDKKYEADIKDLKAKRLPRTMTEFIQEHLGRVFGIPKIANRQLAQIVPALSELYQQKDPYGTLYCKLFQIFDNEPIPVNFAIYITKVRHDFQILIEKYEKSMYSSIKNKAGRVKDLLDEAKSGGIASLVDVTELVTNLFENHRQLGMIIINMLKPEELPLQEYITFLISQKIAKLGKPVEVVFNLIDPDGSSSIDKSEFTTFLKVSFDLWASESDISICFESLSNGSDCISKETFMNKFNTKSYQEFGKNPIFVISKAKFLMSLLEVYKIFMRSETAKLLHELQSYPVILSESDIQKILLSINPEIKFKFESYYKELGGPDKQIFHTDFIKLVTKHGLGGYKKSPFSIPELYTDLDEKKVRPSVEVSILKANSTDSLVKTDPTPVAHTRSSSKNK
jgi:hypothetical protein